MMGAASAASADPLEGTWRVTRHGVNCVTGVPVNSFQAIMQFSKGETATGFGVPPGSTPSNSTSEYVHPAPFMQRITADHVTEILHGANKGQIDNIARIGRVQVADPIDPLVAERGQRTLSLPTR